MANMERHFKESPYEYCMLCGRRRPLADMSWQDGALKCSDNNWCNDTALIGSRERDINRVLSRSDREMQPDKKLISPASATGGIEEILL